MATDVGIVVIRESEECRIMTHCPFCGSVKGFIEVHGSRACLNCHTKVVGCCGD